MKIIANIAVLVAIFIASPVFAGEIFGVLSEGNRPVKPGVRIEITADGGTYSAVTGRFGDFRIYVPRTGPCQVRVHYQQQSPSLGIFSYERAVRYDLVLEKVGGQYSLRRR